MYYPHIPTEFQIPNLGDFVFPKSYKDFDFDYDFNSNYKSINEPTHINKKVESSSFFTSGWFILILSVVVVTITVFVILMLTGFFHSSKEYIPGPQGSRGPQGLKGLQGPQGPTGDFSGVYEGVVTAEGFSTGNSNTFIGYGSNGSNNTSGTNNTYLGVTVGTQFANGSSDNIAIGTSAGPSFGDTTVYSNTFWLPKTLGIEVGSGSGIYLLAYDTNTGRVFPINGGTVQTSSIPSDP